MKTNKYKSLQPQLLSILLLSTLSPCANARYGYHGGGGGWAGGGNGGGQGMGQASASASAAMDGNSGTHSRREMMQLIHRLVDSHDDVTRYYNETDVGIESYTFSDDPDVATWIQEHVSQMTALMTSYPEHGGIRMRDPLFKATFDFSNFHEMSVTNTTDGVRVVQNVVAEVVDTNTKDCAIAIIKEHAAVVSKFAAHGRSEMRKNHEAPTICKNAPRKVAAAAADARISDPTLATRAQETKVVAAAALETTTMATANAAAMTCGSGQMASILTCVLLVAKVLLF
mmetsp:Transcript_19740/g.25223  ORF Transcript_19740/g.25223 Transcript_19740/m.25223 type:complete len:285 (+) Transcript_19740:95-949(+)